MGLLRSFFRNHPVARPFGIEVGVHGSLIAFAAVLVLLDGLAGGGLAALTTTALVVALFGSVALHELGHALAARMYGVRTRAITLLPIGGIAMLESDLRRPREEMVVAIAGPAVNLAIVGAISVFLRIFGGLLGGSTLGGFILDFSAFVLDMNVALAAFNLLPAFPMDGGRVLRALLSQRLGRLRATRIAARLGSVLAVGLGVAGLVGWIGSPMVVLVAAFVYFAAQAELRRVEAEHAQPFGPFGPLGAYGPWFIDRSARTLHVPPGFYRVVEARE